MTVHELRPQPDLLTAIEHSAVEAIAAAAVLVRQVIDAGADGDATVARFDWFEAAAHVHALQNLVLAQAAARAYPSRYRLAGATIAPSHPEETR